MKWEIVKYCLFAGVCFGSWPLLMKKSEIGSVDLRPALNAFILCVATTIIVGGQLFLMRSRYSIPWLSLLMMFLAPLALFAVGAGFINGLGSLNALKWLSSVSSTEVAKMTFVMVITQVSTTAIGSAIFLHEPFPLRKLAALFLGATSVALLVL